MLWNCGDELQAKALFVHRVPDPPTTSLFCGSWEFSENIDVSLAEHAVTLELSKHIYVRAICVLRSRANEGVFFL